MNYSPSSFYYPSSLWGIVIQGEDFDKFASELSKNHAKDDTIEDILDAELSGIMTYAILHPNEDAVSPDLDIYSEHILILGLDKQPDLTSGPAYGSLDEAINEIKKKVGKFIPENFNYKENMGCHSYAFYG
ncbi:hypothetical protein FC36_GL001174 [Ligilactobacillus equi DSM 15833 = JCM 10991]|nr:hypothetical protein FC36_GL001174 [Ligilactobacillus equi DSM 15833 = JCM 10991]